MRIGFGLAGAIAACLIAGGPARADAPGGKCEIGLLATMKVDFTDDSWTLPGQVDGHAIRALVDTGAARTVISRPAAQALKLTLDDLPGFRAYGVGGATRVQSARIGVLTLVFDVRRGAPGVGRPAPVPNAPAPAPSAPPQP